MKKISKKTLNSSFWRWWYGNLTCFSHEHMQTFGYMWSMLPIIMNYILLTKNNVKNDDLLSILQY